MCSNCVKKCLGEIRLCVSEDVKIQKYICGSKDNLAASKRVSDVAQAGSSCMQYVM